MFSSVGRSVEQNIYLGVCLQVRPDIKTRDPLTEDPILSSEWNTENVSVLSSNDLLQPLATCGSNSIRQQPGYLHQIKLGGHIYQVSHNTLTNKALEIATSNIVISNIQ